CAFWAVQGISGKAQPAMAALASKDPTMRINAIQRIAGSPMSNDARSALMTCLADSDCRVRHEAVAVLARVDPRVSLIPLMQALSDPDRSISELARESLAALDISATTDEAWRGAFASSLQSVRVCTAEHIEIGATPEKVVGRLRMALDDPIAEVRAAAAG